MVGGGNLLVNVGGIFFFNFFGKKEDYAMERLLSCCFGAMEIVFKIKR